MLLAGNHILDVNICQRLCLADLDAGRVAAALVALDDLFAQMIHLDGAPGAGDDALLAADALLLEKINQTCRRVLDQSRGGADLRTVRYLTLTAYCRHKCEIFVECDHIDAGIQRIEDIRLLKRTRVHTRPAAGAFRRLKHKYLHAHASLMLFPFQMREV